MISWNRWLIVFISFVNLFVCQEVVVCFSSNMSIKEITSGNGGFVILPSIKHTATFFLLHGLGDSAKGIGSLARQMSVKFPYIKFIVPTAPNRPLTMRGGARMNAWYDLATINDDEPDPCTGAKESADYIVKLIEDEIASGIPSNRIILSGFSQGGIMSLFIGLSTSLNLPLGGLIVFSSYLRKALPFNFNPALQNTPILHNHGLDDPVVRLLLL